MRFLSRFGFVLRYSYVFLMLQWCVFGFLIFTDEWSYISNHFANKFHPSFESGNESPRLISLLYHITVAVRSFLVKCLLQNKMVVIDNHFYAAWCDPCIPLHSCSIFFVDSLQFLWLSDSNKQKRPILFERQIYKERRRNRKRFSILGLTPHVTAAVGAGPVWGIESGTTSGPPTWVQGPKDCLIFTAFPLTMSWITIWDTAIVCGGLTYYIMVPASP